MNQGDQAIVLWTVLPSGLLDWLLVVMWIQLGFLSSLLTGPPPSLSDIPHLHGASSPPSPKIDEDREDENYVIISVTFWQLLEHFTK